MFQSCDKRLQPAALLPLGGKKQKQKAGQIKNKFGREELATELQGMVKQ